MTDNNSYMSSTKSNPLLKNQYSDGTYAEAWDFQGFTLVITGTINIEDINVYNSDAFVKCVFETDSSIPLIIHQNDFIQNQSYPARIVWNN